LQFTAGAAHGDAEAGRHSYAWGSLDASGIEYVLRRYSIEDGGFQAAPFPTDVTRFEEGFGTFGFRERGRLPSSLQDWLLGRGATQNPTASVRSLVPTSDPPAAEFILSEPSRGQRGQPVEEAEAASTPAQVDTVQGEKDPASHRVVAIPSAPPINPDHGSMPPPSTSTQLGMALRQPQAPDAPDSKGTPLHARTAPTETAEEVMSLRDEMIRAKKETRRAYDNLWRLLALPLIAVVVGVVTAYVPCFHNGVDRIHVLRNTGDHIQLATVLLFFTFLLRTKPATETSSINEFLRYWKIAWFGWLGVYAVYSGYDLLAPTADALLPGWDVATTLFVNLTNVAMLGLYLEMSRPTADGERGAHRRLIHWVLGACVWFTALEVCLIRLNPDSSLWVNTVDFIFGVLAGLFGALSLILLAMEIKRAFAEIRFFEFVFLLVYGAIQVLFVIARKGWLPDTLPLAAQFVLKALALLLKLALFFLVDWQITSDRLVLHLGKRSAAHVDTHAGRDPPEPALRAALE
jgi:hypothetical protein